MPAQHDTTVIGVRRGTSDLPQPPASIPAGWFIDPYRPDALRYWDGARWSNHTASVAAARQPAPPARRGHHRSVLLGALLAFCFGGLALAYLLPLPAVARWAAAGAAVLVLGWWTLLVIPATWPIAIIAVPLGAAAMRRSAR
jgi:hypothetical protein